MNTMQVERFFCICNDYNDRCWQLGGIHYIILPEVEVVSGERRAKNIDFRIEVSEIKQKDRKFWVGGHSAMYIDLMSNVPQVEDEKMQSDLAVDLLKKEGYGNYQRKLNQTRVNNFGKFWENPENSLVNGITIATNYTPVTGEKKEKNVIYFDESDRELIISDKFLGSECDDCSNNVYEQLEAVLDQIDKDALPDKYNHISGLIEKVNEWKKRTKLPYSSIKTYHCLNPRCKSKDNKNHHTNGISQNHFAKYKPFSVLDGQHRVKGSQRASIFGDETGICLTCKEENAEYTIECAQESHEQKIQINNFHDEAIPFTLVSEGYGGFPIDQQGRLFAQITTEAKPLEYDHLRYMSWRFSLEHDGADFTPGSTTRDGICFKVLLTLAKEGLLSNRFRLLGELKNGNADDDILKQFYVTTPKKLFELIKYVDNEYFRHFGNYYDDRPERIDDYASAIRNYFQACYDELFSHSENKIWSTDSDGKVSGNQNSGSSSMSPSTLWFKALFRLMKDVFSEVAIDKYLDQKPAATAEDLENDKPEQSRRPHEFSISEIQSVLAYMPGFDFGVSDGMDQKFLGNDDNKLHSLLRHLIIKPKKISDERSNLQIELDEIGGV
jgi:hypothetical protein